MENQPLQKALALGGRRGALDRDLEGLDDLAVLHARRAGGFACAAVETEVQVMADLLAQTEAAVGDGAHQVDASARAVVLIRGFDIRRAARGAEAAVNAVLKEAVLDLLGEPVEVDEAWFLEIGRHSGCPASG